MDEEKTDDEIEKELDDMIEQCKKMTKELKEL